MPRETLNVTIIDGISLDKIWLQNRDKVKEVVLELLDTERLLLLHEKRAKGHLSDGRGLRD
jgi:hypothetical protein